MSDHFDQTIAELQKTLLEQEKEVIKTKEMINRLCEYAGKQPLYSDIQLETSRPTGVIRSDQFYGKPLASTVREVLSMRQDSNLGPATVKEIYEALVEGGYHFDTKNAQNAMRNLRISLAKNVALFHKLPNGQFGLVAWYPKIQKNKSGKNDTGQTDGSEDSDGSVNIKEDIE